MTSRTPALLTIAAALALGATACGGDGGGDAAGSTDATVGSATSVSAGACPEKTEIEIAGAAGPTTFTAASAYADVTLDQSATVLITSYAVEPSVAEGIYNPSLSGDQAGVTFYVSTTDGGNLETGTYVSTSADAAADLVLNTSSAYDGNGRVFATGFDLPEPIVEITEISDTKVCGTVTTPEFSGDFAADRI